MSHGASRGSGISGAKGFRMLFDKSLRGTSLQRNYLRILQGKESNKLLSEDENLEPLSNSHNPSRN